MPVAELQKPTGNIRPLVRFEPAEHQHKAVIFICFEYITRQQTKKLNSWPVHDGATPKKPGM